MILPVLTVGLVLVLFAGFVWLAAEGVSHFKGEGTDRIAGEGEDVIERVASLISRTRVVNSALPQIGGRTYDFLADIDGDGGTGRFGSAEYGKGLERIIIYRPSISSPELRVDVYSAPRGRPRSLVLTCELDEDDPDAFGVDCAIEPVARGDGSAVHGSQQEERKVRVRVTVAVSHEKDGSSRAGKFSETIDIEAFIAEKKP